MEKYYINSTKFSLQERQTKKHGKVYDAVFRIIDIEGNEKQKKLSGYKTKTLAKEAHDEFILKHCELVKGNPIKRKDGKKGTPTISDLFPEYIKSLGNQLKESSVWDKTHIFNVRILPTVGEEKIDDLTKEYLFRWQDEVWNMRMPNGEFYSYKYLCKIRSDLSAFLSWVQERYGYINHMPEVKKPKRRTPKTEMQIWTREEFDTFLSVIENPMHRCFFTLLFYTGRRKSEILALTKEDLTPKGIRINKNITRRTLDGSTYKVTSTKADKSQVIPVCDTVKETLNIYKGEAPFYFGGRSPLGYTTIQYHFNKYIEASGVKRIRIHDLRHSFVSMLIHLGANYNVIADLIGDTVEQVIKTYGHMYQSDKEEIISRIG